MDTGEEKDKGEVENKEENTEEEAISTSSAVSQLSQIMTKIVDLPIEETEENNGPQVVAENKETTDISNKGVFFLKDKLMEKADSNVDVKDSPTGDEIEKNVEKETCVDTKEPSVKETSSAVSQMSQIMTKIVDLPSEGTEENNSPQVV